MAKKGVFKKIFGKSKSKGKQSAKDATSSSSGGGTGRVSSNPTPVERAAAKPAPPVPPPPQPQARKNDDAEKFHSAPSDAGSDRPGGPGAASKKRSEGKGGGGARSTPGAAKPERLPAAPAAGHARNEAVASDAAADERRGLDVDAHLKKSLELLNVGGVDPDDMMAPDPVGEAPAGTGGGVDPDDLIAPDLVVEVPLEGGVDPDDLLDLLAPDPVREAADRANEVETKRGDDAESDGMAAGEGNDADEKKKDLAIEVEESEEATRQEDGAEKKNKRAWAEERISQLHSPSAAKLLEKPKIEVGNEISPERRKWIEGLSSPKKEPSASNIPDELKNAGGLSAQRKATEDMLRRLKDPKAFLDSQEQSFREKGTDELKNAGALSAQRKATEDMLRRLKDPKAFLDSKESPRGPLPTGAQGLSSRRTWVLETLEKQNDPKSFLDRDKESRRKIDTSNEQRETFEERKKFLETKATEAKEKAVTQKKGGDAETVKLAADQANEVEKKKGDNAESGGMATGEGNEAKEKKKYPEIEAEVSEEPTREENGFEC